MLQAAYQAWTTDTHAGAASLLLAVDTATVAALNERARTDRITTGHVAADGIRTRDGTTIGAGDRVITRRNDRRLTLHRTGQEYVRNGMLWDVTTIHPDGSLTLTPTPAGPRAGADAGAGGVRVPAEYAARHVDLGYAVTVHRAQGATVETAHLLTGPGLTREALYVGMTRGRTANHTYITTDPATPDHDRLPGGEPGTAMDVLTAVLATVGSEPSATAALRTQHAAALSPARLAPIADTLAADLTRRRWTRLLTASSLEPALVEQIQACPQAGALYAALARAETAGHTPARILDQLAAIATDSTGDSEAGVRGLRRGIDTWIDTHPAATLTGPITPRVTGDPDDPAVQPFTAIRDLIDRRLAQHLASHTDPGPREDQGADTAPTRRAPDPYSTAANHIPIGGPSP
jgi:hypothetical protein